MSVRSGPSARIETKIRDVLHGLKGLTYQDRLIIAYRTGKLVVDTLFGGDLGAWQKRGARDRAYAKLEAHPELPISGSELYQSLQIHELCCRFPGVLLSKLMTLSHLVEVLPLEPCQQQLLLERAEQERWSVRRMRDAAAPLVALAPPATGRPRTPSINKTLSALAAARAFEGAEALLAVDKKTAKALLGICDRALEEIERAKRNLRVAVSERPSVRVLLVDGDRAFLARARLVLRQQDCAVRNAHSCKEALVQVDSETRLAVINLVLPDGSGEELSQRLIELHPKLEWFFMTDKAVPARATNALNGKPVVRKSSGLWPLRVALAKAQTNRSLSAERSFLPSPQP
ncbi:MAG TPA: hypothetical protein VGJ84_10585 [Polyangiaceae bacterium]|jgi:CheY-like chemotaxis protein